jgi:formylglycine-generating enzyme required for sulfatase activity
MKNEIGSSSVFVGLVALYACSAPDMPAEAVVISPVAMEPSLVAPGGTTAAAVASSALPEAPSSYLSNDPPEDDMVDVPAGSFWMGCAKGDPDCRDDEKPRHKVTLRAFQIDRLEVTVQQYQTCLRVGACKGGGFEKDCNINLEGRDHHGMNCVGQGEAHGLHVAR